MSLHAEYLIKAFAVLVTLGAAAVILHRAGRSPYFSLLLLAPFVNIGAVWLFAFSTWPKADKK
jgi:hypothetical protein